jgi:hypothetical protein
LAAAAAAAGDSNRWMSGEGTADGKKQKIFICNYNAIVIE